MPKDEAPDQHEYLLVVSPMVYQDICCEPDRVEGTSFPVDILSRQMISGSLRTDYCEPMPKRKIGQCGLYSDSNAKPMLYTIEDHMKLSTRSPGERLIRCTKIHLSSHASCVARFHGTEQGHSEAQVEPSASGDSGEERWGNEKIPAAVLSADVGEGRHLLVNWKHGSMERVTVD
nr:hypothetical protein CFP56_62788 [Quercus suber]